MDPRFYGDDKKSMNEKNYLKKIIIFAAIFLFIFLFFINKNKTYESETIALFLPKNETTARNLDSTIGNFKQILLSLAFNDRLSDGSDALEPGLELPNYKRKEFWNSKVAVEQLKKSGAVSIKNFDASSGLAQELNIDTIESLIAIAGNYYNIKTDLGIRIIDGPIVKQAMTKNLLATFWQSALWSIGLYLILLFLFPASLIKKTTGQRPLPGKDFSKNLTSDLIPKKTALPVFPEEENYFAAVKKKNIFSLPSLPNFPTFGKKAPTPANLPVSEEEVPEIFREKNGEEEPARPSATNAFRADNATHSVAGGEVKKYTPHEATAEEVKARLNQLLSGK